MSVENVIVRTETIVKANIAAEFAIEDARWADGTTLVVPDATSGYFRHAAIVEEMQSVPAVAVVCSGDDTVDPFMTAREDDKHLVEVRYTVRAATKAEVEKRVFRGTFALRRLLRKFLLGGASGAFSGIIQLEIVGARYLDNTVPREGALFKTGTVVTKMKERISF